MMRSRGQQPCWQLLTANGRAQLHVVQDVMQVTAEALVAVGGRGSFIAPKKGALVYGPSCLLYDYVCNFNYQGARPVRSLASALVPALIARKCSGGRCLPCIAWTPASRACSELARPHLPRAEPCNRQGICQTNNTCFCGNGFASCAPSTGLQPLPNTLYGTYASSAGCETDLYTDINNCGHCGNVRGPARLPCCHSAHCAHAGSWQRCSASLLTRPTHALPWADALPYACAGVPHDPAILHRGRVLGSAGPTAAAASRVAATASSRPAHA